MKKIFYTLLLVLAAFDLQAQVQIQAPMPIQTTTFSPNARGYWFVAQSCFTITGAQVPTENPGNQSIAIVRFYATPPTFSTTTNAFTTLFLTQNNPTSGILPVNIQVEQGDIIGVMGTRGSTNSYGNGSAGTTIEGIATPTIRLGMQFPLTTTAPQQLWTEPSSTNISRVWIYYDSLITYNLQATPGVGFDVSFDNDADSSFTSVWNYGDGSGLQTAYNPTHTFPGPGVYTVCTYITNSCGTDTLCTQVTLCGPPPVADFSYTSIGTDATFSDLTNNGTQWSWDFGDGGTDTVQNPNHVYATGGTYTVCLIAGNACGVLDTLCNQVTVCDLPSAQFSSADVPGAATDFTDASSFATSWFWDFGDGATDTTQNPSHTYASNGSYTVCLIAMSSCGSDTTCDSISVCPILATAAYTFNEVNPGVVDFTELATNEFTYFWDFGDGATSVLQNPSHTFTPNGTYIVCLYAGNSCSSDTICDTLTVCPNLAVADFTSSNVGFNYTFSNTGANGATYAWTFGDGGTSTAMSPTHTYTGNGTYQVCLTTTDLCGNTDTFCDSVTVNITSVNPAFADASISLFPNPSGDQTYLSVKLPSRSGSYELLIMDSRGAVVAVQSGQFNETLRVNTSDLSNGVYAYQVKTEGNLMGQGKMILNR